MEKKENAKHYRNMSIIHQMDTLAFLVKINLFGTGNYIDYGAFISSVIYFIIMAFVIFMMVKAMNKLMDLGKKKEEAPVPTTKKCPYCKSEIPLDATRCPHCTSEL